LLVNCVYAQKQLHLNQLHQIHIKNIAQGATPQIYMNENGWVFMQIGGGGDSLKAQSFTTDSSQRGSVLMAFDKQMRLKWSFVYRSGINTSLGGMSIISIGPNNSLYVSCGAKDSLMLPGIQTLYLQESSNSFKGIIDSTGNFSKVTRFEGVYRSSFGAFPISNGKVMVGGNTFPYLLNSDLTIQATGNVTGYNSAVIQPDGIAYYLHTTNAGGSRTILDTLIQGEAGVNKWILTKVNKNGQREWTHVINNNRDFELNENKLLRYDKNGNVFIAIQHRQDISVAGTTIPFYKNGNTLSVTKASILRFAPNGTLLSTHHDTSSTVPFPQNRQTIWLENDKDMNVYAYLFSTGYTYFFDKIDFGDAYAQKHRFLNFNYNTLSFDQAWHVIPPLTDGSIATSFLSNRQVFWYRFNLNTNVFHEGTTLTRLWNDDRVIAVYDTLPPNGPVTSADFVNIPLPNVINVYPNPSSSYFTIQNITTASLNCRVYSIEGKTMHTFQLSAGNTYELNHLNNTGVYFIETTTALGQRFTTRIVKY
jgi:hypothetical protein